MEVAVESVSDDFVFSVFILAITINYGFCFCVHGCTKEILICITKYLQISSHLVGSLTFRGCNSQCAKDFRLFLKCQYEKLCIFIQKFAHHK